MEEYDLIGKRIPRVDGRVKVTGEAKYAADYKLAGMLWCKMLRSPYAHAKILDIDTSRALRVSGVKGVLTGKDFHGWRWGWMPKTRDEAPLADDKARYLAEAVAAVVAVDEDTAEEATELIKVEYEPLPGVFDPEEAMKDGAPRIHDHLKNNIGWEFHMDFGDVERAFRESDLVREDRFQTGRVITGFLRDHPLGCKAESLFRLPAPRFLLQPAPEQDQSHPAFHRGRVWRNQERFPGRGLLCLFVL
jgi:CO/xanthine dehydrogenase Mo-binding subunit